MCSDNRNDRGKATEPPRYRRGCRSKSKNPRDPKGQTFEGSPEGAPDASTSVSFVFSVGVRLLFRSVGVVCHKGLVRVNQFPVSYSGFRLDSGGVEFP